MISVAPEPGMHIVQAGDLSGGSTPDAVAEDVSDLKILSAATLLRINAVFADSALNDSGLINAGDFVHVPILGNTSSGVLPTLLSNRAYVYDSQTQEVYATASSLDGHDSGALIIDTPTPSGFSMLDQGTYSNVSKDADGNTEIGLTSSADNPIGTLILNSSADAIGLKLLDGSTISLSGGSAFHLTEQGGSATQALLGYLSELGDPQNLDQIQQVDLNDLYPATSGYNVHGQPQFQLSSPYYLYEPLISDTGHPVDTVIGHLNATNELEIGDQVISNWSISNIQILTLYAGYDAMTADQFNSFGKIRTFGGEETLFGTSSGTYSLKQSNIQSGINLDLTAKALGGTTLIGDDRDGEILEASVLGDDSLIAGNGAGDLLVAGAGNDDLTGGTGGDIFYVGGGIDTVQGGSGNDTFIVTAGATAVETDISILQLEEAEGNIKSGSLAVGSSITGGGGQDTLRAFGDISGATVSDVQTLQTNYIELTADQLAGFTSVQSTIGSGFIGGSTILAAVGGTYSLAGKSIEAYHMMALSNDGTTLIGDDANGMELTASAHGNDTLIAGNGNNDVLQGGGGNNTFVIGNMPSGTGVTTNVHVTIVGGAGIDTVVYNINASDAVITNNNGNGVNLLNKVDGTLDYLSGVEFVKFADRTVSLTTPQVVVNNVSENVAQSSQVITGTVTYGGGAIISGQTVTLTDNGINVGTTTVGIDGTFKMNVNLQTQGVNSIFASVSDIIGNTISGAVTDTLDSIHPIVTITSGALDTNQASQTISGTVASGGAATVAGQKVTLTDNGVVVGQTVVASNGFFSTSINIVAQGANSIVATVSDSVGNIGMSNPVTDKLDSLAPTVTITSRAVATNKASQTISGTIASAGAATVAGQTVVLTDNGATIGFATVDGNGWSAQVTLIAQGANNIVATASDSFGNTGTSATVTDTLDSIRPAVTITNGAIATNEASQTISGTVASRGAVTVAGQTVTLTDNGTTFGSATVDGNGNWSAQVTLIAQGANSIVATASDSLGNAGASAAVTDTLDSVAPAVTIASAAVATDQAAQVISGTVASRGAATVAGQTVTITDNSVVVGQGVVAGDGSFAIPFNLVAQGANSIVVIVSDSFGNAGSSVVVTDTLDSAAPAVTITSAGVTTDQAAQTISGTVVSSGAAAVAGQTVALTDNGAAFGSATVDGNGNWSAQVTLTGQGANSIVATALDSFGNAGSSVAVVDTLNNPVVTTPKVTIDPTVTFSSAAQATITGTASDPTGISNVEFFQGSKDLGAATLNPDGTFSFTHTFGSGFHAGLYAVATDTDGGSTTLATDFDLTTGIKNSPYASQIDNYDGSGNYLGSSEFQKDGGIYLSSTVSTLANGNQSVLYAFGSFFDTLDFYAYNDVSTPDGNIATETLYNDDGTHTITGYQDGLKIKSIGSDTITGGGQDETFVFAQRTGHDIITDFAASGAGHDILSLSSHEFSSLGQVLHHTSTDSDGDAVIHLAAGNTITLQNVSISDLKSHPHDFSFHA